MKKMRKQLIKLLSIHGTSGNEKPVRDYLKPILTEMMDTVTIDSYGNLLAEKKVGNGEGATVLLSAHMDTVKGVLKDRKLLENNGVITSDKGALGADDRAGIAIIMEVLRNIDKLSFEGTIKVAFSREEEIGCIGSGKIDKDWYSDVDLAIVVDRKGNRDIVVGCFDAFCSTAVGTFFEDVSAMQNMNWKATEGGISDACTFSKNGINSVNLSAGYRHEHTDKEYVVIDDMRDTVALILQALAVINQFVHTFGEVPEENEWVKNGYGYDYGSYGYWKGGQKYYNSSSYKYTDADYPYGNTDSDRFDDMIYAESKDRNGDILMYEIGRDVVIQQGEQEIILTRDSLKNIFSQIKHTV